MNNHHAAIGTWESDEHEGVSTRGVEAKRVRSVRYNPNKIDLDNWKDD